MVGIKSKTSHLLVTLKVGTLYKIVSKLALH
jgi:hypothetical protein